MSARIRRVRRAPTGHLIGESHPRCKHSSEDISLMRQLHVAGLGYGAIAEKFEVSRYTVRDYVKGTRRAYE